MTSANPTEPSNAGLPDSRARRPAAGPWARVGMVLFAIGLLAILADLLLFATGSRNLPVWLNVACMMAPVGLGVGLIGVVRQARADGRARAARVSRDTAPE
ncbi:MAG: hypothetical protein ABJA16_06970 [Nakamurella sp.]